MPDTKVYDIIFKILEENKNQDKRTNDLDKRLGTTEKMAIDNSKKICKIEQEANEKFKVIETILFIFSILSNRIVIVIIVGVFIAGIFGKDAFLAVLKALG